MSYILYMHNNRCARSNRMPALVVRMTEKVMALIDRLVDQKTTFSLIEGFNQTYERFYKPIFLRVIDGAKSVQEYVHAKPE